MITSGARTCLISMWVMLLCVSCSMVRAEHALSEVWSEADGLRMKYSTNHDDLMSTKGSELSLSSDQRQQEAEPTAAAAAQQQQEAEVGNDEAHSTSSSSNANEEQQQDNEQGADSGRHTDKVPPPMLKSSGAAYNVRHMGAAAQNVRQIESLDQDENSDSSERDDTSGETRPASRPSSLKHSAALQPQDASLSFDSALEQTQDQEAANADKEERSSASADNEERQSVRFRQPGRLFKEAVHLSGDSDGANEQSDSSNNNNNKRTSSSYLDSNSDSDSQSASRQSESASAAAAQPDEENNDEEGGSDAFGKTASSPRARDNMIDFDHMQAGGLHKHRPDAAGYHQHHQSPAAQYGGFDGEPNFRPQSFFNEQSGRALASGSHKSERTQTSGRPGSLVSSSGVTSKRPASSAAQQLSTGSAKLGYFRNVEAASPRFRSATVGSPDSVRDNFISPGHYPGSMPHLTQAASEQAPAPASAAPEVVSSGDSNKLAQESSQQASVVKPAPPTPQPAQPTTTPATTTTIMSDTMDQASALVTPTPEAQPESQQIMAPILLTTTTMAPLPATSQAPSLKRFKFRKYR